MRLIFDIGCHWGHWLSANYNYNDTFIGVEANERVFNLTKERFSEFNNVHILHRLVSDVDNKKELFYVASHSDGEVSTASRWWIRHSRHAPTEQWNDGVEVRTITIDRLVNIYGVPDFIKIDVEGYENKVLRGMTKNYGALCFEWCEEQPDLLDSIEHLHDLGYHNFNWSHGDDYLFRPSEWWTYKKMKKEILTLVPERQQRWGMIYAS